MSPCIPRRGALPTRPQLAISNRGSQFFDAAFKFAMQIKKRDRHRLDFAAVRAWMKKSEAVRGVDHAAFRSRSNFVQASHTISGVIACIRLSGARLG